MAASPTVARRLSGAVFIVVMLAIAAVLFYLVWFLDSGTPFTALVAIGFLALVFGLVAYLLRAFVAEPVIGQVISWGFLGMGFVVLFATAGLYNDPSVAFVPTRIGLLLGTLVLFAVTVLGFYWRSGQLPAEAERKAERKEWQARPPASAFDYAAARPPQPPPPPSSGGGSAP